MREFKVELPFYSGPLDLLVHLVRVDELDVLEVSVAEIARRYLELIATPPGPPWDLDEIGDFLVLASTLMEFKSRALVPGPAVENPDIEPEVRSELVRQLLEYKRFKEVAALLWDRAEEWRKRVGRKSDPWAQERTDLTTQPIRELELWDLVSAFSRLMKETVIPMADRVQRDPTPITTYMARLEELVLAGSSGRGGGRSGGGVTFRDLMGSNNSRVQLIGKFLALLELIKCKQVWVEFDEAIGEIVVLPPRPAATAGDAPSLPMADGNVPPDALLEAKRAGPLAPVADVEAPSTRAGATADVEKPEGGRVSPWADYEPLVGERPNEPTPDAKDDFEWSA